MSLVREIPNLKLILAHAGFPEYSDGWETIQDTGNVNVDLSADAYVNGKMTAQAVEHLGVGGACSAPTGLTVTMPKMVCLTTDISREESNGFVRIARFGNACWAKISRN